MDHGRVKFRSAAEEERAWAEAAKHNGGMLTVTHAAATSGVPRRTILRAIKLGHIQAVKTGPATAAWLITPESFNQWLKERHMKRVGFYLLAGAVTAADHILSWLIDMLAKCSWFPPTGTIPQKYQVRCDPLTEWVDGMWAETFPRHPDRTEDDPT